MARILIALVLAVTAWAADPTYADVQPMVEQAIKLLEAKDIDGFVALTVEPKLLKELKDEPQSQFAENKEALRMSPDRLLAKLRLTAKATATWDAAAASLTFAHPEMNRNISFVRIDNHWYMKL